MNRAVPLASQSDATLEAVGERASLGGVGYALVYIPFVGAVLLSGAPLASFFVAWLGSFWILWLSLSGRVRAFEGGGTALDQILRPVALTQILFVTYNFAGSIFYVADLFGYYYFERLSNAVVPYEEVAVVAEAQRYYVLAHASIVVGMLAAMDYRRSGEWQVRPLRNPSFVLFAFAVACYLGSEAFGVTNQLGGRLDRFSLIATILGFALAMVERRWALVLVGAVLYLFLISEALLSGWKEGVLTPVLLLAVFLYPYARRLVLFGAPIALVFLLAVLPAYTNVVRSLTWRGGEDAETGAAVAVEEIREGGIDLGGTNWSFLSYRLTQVSMFTEFIHWVDAGGGHYGTQILEQAAIGLVPRALWPEKPNMEVLSMERIYAMGIVETYSDVSAKSPYVVDGYLSYGTAGVALFGLLFGLLASWASRASERWFGGYLWGSGLVFTAMFTVFWKGSGFEFFFNTVLWSFILLVPLFWIGRATGVLIPREEAEEWLELDDLESAASRRASRFA